MSKQTPAEVNKPKQLDAVGKKTLLAILSTKTFTAAARQLGICRTQLYNRMEKYGLREMIEEIPDRALARLRLASVDAAEVLSGKLEVREESLEAAESILDRVGVRRGESKRGAAFKVENKDMKVEFIEMENES
jgi:hypothetical protein